MNMKKWLTPSAIQENLMADAAVAVTSCGSYNATLYCAIPGIDKNHVNDGPIPRLDDSGLWHLSECINPGTADITAGTGMESGYNPHPIHDIKIGTKVDSMKSYVDKILETIMEAHSVKVVFTKHLGRVMQTETFIIIMD